MSGSELANIIIGVVSSVVILVMATRSAHYIKTGRWFR